MKVKAAQACNPQHLGGGSSRIWNTISFLTTEGIHNPASKAYNKQSYNKGTMFSRKHLLEYGQTLTTSPGERGITRERSEIFFHGCYGAPVYTLAMCGYVSAHL